MRTKHLLLLLAFVFLFNTNIYPQSYGAPVNDAKKEAKNDTTWYTVKGERHGISYFKLHTYDEVEYEIGEKLTFDKYHANDVMYSWLDRWVNKYPDIMEVYEVGRSFEGRPILQVTITNKKTGRDTDKPAAYFEGGRHSGEVTSSESVLWLIKHLLENYGNDKKITRLIDTKAIYLRPKNNPDGSNLYLHTAQRNRSSVRPHDNDMDGLFDEDANEDLDGDGIIFSLRWKVKDGEEDKGNAILDPRDPSGRLMKSVPEGKGDWRVVSEGIDNDGDGKFNEDGIGGLDLHRNYPENWRPERQDEATGRGWTQRGAGAYPLSETETRSVVTFLLSHPHIYIVNSMDTRVPMHLRAPSTSPSEERMYDEDREWYEYFDTLGKQITGYSRAGDVYQDYGGGNPIFGHGPDFGYWYYGAIWYGDELWNGARFKDYDEDGDTDELDLLRWDDEENNGDGFIEWTPAKHPVYGEVELGGFHPKFFAQNAPAKHLLPWVRNQALFNLEMVKHLPQVEWDDVKVKKLKTYKNDSADYLIKVRFYNTGKLPTALKQAYLVKIVRQDQAKIMFDKKWFVGETPALKILSENPPRRQFSYFRGSDPSVQSSETKKCGFTMGGASTTAEFKIRVYKPGSYTGKASVQTTRAGVLKPVEFELKF